MFPHNLVLRIFLAGSLLIADQLPAYGQAKKPHDPNVPVPVALLLSRYGFEQPKIALPPGTYHFSVVNRSGLHGISMTLERMPGASVSGSALSREFQEDNKRNGLVLAKSGKLTPGTYRLRITEAPGWVVAIEVK